MPDTPDRAAREAAVQALRELAATMNSEAQRWRGLSLQGYVTGRDAAAHARRATQLEAVAAWLEGRADG